MADNLESYFKKHLSGESPGEDNWNVPSDDVWDKVAPVIEKKRGIFIPWRYFYIIGILLISLGLFFWFWNTPEESSRSSDLLPSDQSEISTNSSDPGPTNQTEQTFIATDSETTFGENIRTDKNAIELNEADQEKTSLTENEQSEVKSATTTILAIDNLNDKSSSSQAYVAEETSVDNFSETSRDDIPETARVVYVNPIYSQNITLAEETINNEVRIPEADYKTVDNTREPIDNKGRVAVGAFFTPTWTSTFTRGDPTNGLIENNNMFLYSNNWGFEIKYFISNRFTIVTGVGKSEIRSWSKSSMDFDYDTSTEHIMETGEKENSSHVPMPTPFGKIDTELTYRFSGDDEIPDGEPMLSAFETHQELRYLSIPIGVEYNLIRASRFSWFAEGGLRYNRALRDATTFTSRVLHEGHDMDVVGEEMMNHPTYTENYLNFYLGTGANYQFSRKLQISASGRYFGSITKVNLQDNLSTYVNGFNLKVGLIYIF